MGSSQSKNRKSSPPSDERRLPPHNAAAEEAVLGSLIIDQEEIDRVVQILKPHHFYRDKNRLVYQMIVYLWENDQEIDQLTVAHELERRNKLVEVGGASYLSVVVERLPTSAHVVHYAQIIKSCYIDRKIIEIAGAMAGRAWGSKDALPEEKVQACQDLFDDLYAELGEHPFVITDFTKIQTDPPRYSMKVNDRPVEVSLEELVEFKRFRRKVISECDFAPMKISEEEWIVRVNLLLRKRKVEPAPKEASAEYSIWQAALALIKGQPLVETVPEFCAGLPVQRNEYLFVQGNAFLGLWAQKLKQTRGSAPEPSVLWSILKRMGQAEKSTVRFGQEVKGAWRLPATLLNGHSVIEEYEINLLRDQSELL